VKFPEYFPVIAQKRLRPQNNPLKKIYKKSDFKQITSAAASSSLALPSAMLLNNEDIYWTSVEAQLFIFPNS
jgi:hypothetical protein